MSNKCIMETVKDFNKSLSNDIKIIKLINRMYNREGLNTNQIRMVYQYIIDKGRKTTLSYNVSIPLFENDSRYFSDTRYDVVKCNGFTYMGLFVCDDNVRKTIQMYDIDGKIINYYIKND